MELIYIWIDKYRNYRNTGVNFSNKFHVNYDYANSNIIILKKLEYAQLYPNYIQNISIILGKNSTGKTNLLDLIGMRVEDRNVNGQERERIYSYDNNDINILKENKIKKTIKNSQYFLLYYLGVDNEGKDLFCFEGNDIEKYINLLENRESWYLKKDYRVEKYWFTFICTYDENKSKLVFKYGVTDDGGMNTKDNIYDLTTKNTNVIILFRDKFSQIYNYNSFKPEDEYKVAMARRIAHFETRYIYKKINFLIDQIRYNCSNKTIKKNIMYSDENYKLNIIFDNYYDYDKYQIISYKDIKVKLSLEEKTIIKITSIFCFDFASVIISKSSDNSVMDYFINLNTDMDTYDDIKNYYMLVIEELLKMNRNEAESKKYYYNTEEDEYYIKSYNNLINSLEYILFKDNSDKLDLKIRKDRLIININKTTNKDMLEKLLIATVDESTNVLVNKLPYSLFNNFFSWSIENLSDGELYYLNIMSSIDEQIDEMTQIKTSVEKKEKYILLFDEPEIRMHPELARKFIDELINLLRRYENKTFQIIIASHSAFLVSDIPKSNVICIEKEGYVSKVKPCELNTFGQNIHTLYKSTFFMSNTIGEYSKKIIDEITKKLNSYEKVKLSSSKLSLAKIENINVEIDNIEKIINMIGEDIIRQLLKDKLKKVKMLHNSNDKSELNKIKMEYEKLSNDEKKNFIDFIVNS